MTPFPHAIEATKTASEALEVMMAHRFRHLPVTQNHAALGMVTERSIKFATLEEGRPASQLSVKRALTPQPYLVDLNTPLDVVIEEMARRQVASAVVTKGEKVAGIFTMVDVCRLFADTLRGNLTPDDVA
ncbi:MAG: Hypoxic response protein 1 [Pseudomonadota bacterium]|jgi:CBS domain-containing protein